MSSFARWIGWLGARAYRQPLAAVGVAALVVVGLWLVSGLVSASLTVAAWVLVAGSTFAVAAPDVQMLLGRGDTRPWLVRMRQHTWRRVPLPGGSTVNRVAAYGLLVLGWWWLLR